jgi:hypothetical protein
MNFQWMGTGGDLGGLQPVMREMFYTLKGVGWVASSRGVSDTVAPVIWMFDRRSFPFRLFNRRGAYVNSSALN